MCMCEQFTVFVQLTMRTTSGLFSGSADTLWMATVSAKRLMYFSALLSMALFEVKQIITMSLTQLFHCKPYRAKK